MDVVGSVRDGGGAQGCSEAFLLPLLTHVLLRPSVSGEALLLEGGFLGADAGVLSGEEQYFYLPRLLLSFGPPGGVLALGRSLLLWFCEAVICGPCFKVFPRVKV